MAAGERSTERLAVLSDIHGNIWALEAVLDQITQMGITDIVNLGDSVYGPLDPAGTARLLIDREIPSARGNEDRLITEGMKGEPRNPTLDYVLSSLTPDQITWIQSLSFDMTVDGVFYLCHGTPFGDAEYLLRKVDPVGDSMRSDAELAELLKRLDHDVVLCGHDHLQADRRLPDGVLIVDPGSVGLPAYSDDMPFPHTMEAGTPHARFSVIEKRGHDYIASHHEVQYDWERAAAAAELNGRADWALWLRTGMCFV